MNEKEPSRILIQKNCLLLVEGPRDDERFFKALLKKLGIEEKVQVIPIYGKTNLRYRLKAVVEAPKQDDALEIASIGIVRDADTDPSAAFRSVRDALRDIGFPVPQKPLLAVGERPRVIVMILPDENSIGMIEDLCLRSVDKDAAIVCVEQYFQCLHQQNIALPRHSSKAKVQVYLASKPECGKRLGEAAEAGYWPWEEKTFDQAKDFLGQVCLGL